MPVASLQDFHPGNILPPKINTQDNSEANISKWTIFHRAPHMTSLTESLDTIKHGINLHTTVALTTLCRVRGQTNYLAGRTAELFIRDRFAHLNNSFAGSEREKARGLRGWGGGGGLQGRGALRNESNLHAYLSRKSKRVNSCARSLVRTAVHISQQQKREQENESMCESTGVSKAENPRDRRERQSRRLIPRGGLPTPPGHLPRPLGI